ncbi:maleylpyruvate isomerase family mycothiol-dependent enzyme [Arthrobacter sp. zg-Y916]|uniref:Maleylpyruvate isomerase family mycothiol-dependent enzyme n=1 Tax=Arthrobacter caoxuetaonis TaxID=2886935 RepID=A0A9X1MC24_9MICC|nr:MULTISPECIES: maleylpyruvate isomerase family mycothiol-dependent enzyme [Arthrobacter]MCC3296991.1 maleylpyruvate isomerase family mycothiol-dependent enzyme [Arthrobacter caoxuetaonis]MCC9193878.1 maleylpyruvate isomerase family mycothiol-dependent enzyme [Arthrobacter sp. zg-Y916]USQ58437.1 maleylpyruvate isomerase family mycothiol-dependent enzyme [Arthrobacter caoxuetaonis]
MTEQTNAELLAAISTAAQELARHLPPLSDEQVAAPSRLPGWSRGHVLAHVAGVSTAMARQVEFAARGETVELYDGGVDGRNQAIERGALRSAAEHRAVLAREIGQAIERFTALDDAGWSAAISYRGGVVRDGAEALWRELVIHLSDLDIGVDADAWPPAFSDHLFGFLSARVPDGLRLRLQPLGHIPRTIGNGPRTVAVNGMATDIAAWLAGRHPSLGSLRADADADGVALPVLLPWPSAMSPQ